MCCDADIPNNVKPLDQNLFFSPIEGTSENSGLHCNLLSQILSSCDHRRFVFNLDNFNVLEELNDA